MGKSVVIAEKPSVGKDFAKVLNCKNRKDGFIEGDNYIVTWAFGHLFTLYEPEDYKDKYSSWNLEDLPIIPNEFKTKVADGKKKQFNIIKRLINRKDVNLIINGGDAGREGELIQRYIIQRANKNNKPVKRFWVNDLTLTEIKKGFNNLKPASKYDGYYYSAKTRAEIDWLIGMNYSRAYTIQNKGSQLITVGRVQTAVLNLIKERDEERANFDPTPYWQIVNEFGEEYTGKYISKNDNTRVWNKEKAQKIKKECKGKTGEVTKVNREKKKKYAPKLFNLTGLQKQMNKYYGFSAKETLDIAQKLYENYKMITYPRTDSKYLGKSHIETFTEMFKKMNFSKFKDMLKPIDYNDLNISKRFINGSKVSDHHAIIPTLNPEMKHVYNNKLSKNERLVFDEVAKRLLAQFYEPNIYSSTKVITTVLDKYNFETKGKITLEKGWKKIYDTNNKDKKLPNLKKGDKKEVTNSHLNKKKTRPPKHFTENKLLTKLEKYNIGTEATRADMIEKLIYRKYIRKKGKKLITTESGKEIIDVIVTENIKKPELTKKLEDKLEAIEKGKEDNKKVLKEEIENIKGEIEKIKNTAVNIGKEKQKGKKHICNCPKCESGKIIKRKNFYGCTNYSNDEINCDFTIPKISKKMLTTNQVQRLCQKGKTKMLRGFKKKNGGKYKARLVITDEYEIDLEFPKRTNEKLDIDCPLCSKGQIVDKGKFYGCTNYQNGCQFTIGKKYVGKKINNKILKQLSRNKETEKLQGFKSKKGNTFPAKIKIKENGKLELDFN